MYATRKCGHVLFMQWLNAGKTFLARSNGNNIHPFLLTDSEEQYLRNSLDSTPFAC